MKTAQAIIQILEKEGIRDAFGIPGAGINPVYQYLQGSRIKHYTMRHEEAAVHAADGYFRACGRMAMAICTSGPGATNFVTGLYTANVDSIPLIAITGQNITSQLGKDAFQCVDIAEICRPIAKKTWCVMEAAKVPAVLAEAFLTARSGKPGPVLVDLPLDVQMAEIEFDIEQYRPLPVPEALPAHNDIARAMDLLLEAKAPVIIMGGGVMLANAEAALLALAEYMQIPVIQTYMAKGGIPEAHPLNAGHMGIQVGQPLGNKVFLDSDVVLAVGCRFTDRHTGDIKVYTQGRRFIHINIAEKEIGKIVKADVAIAADAGAALIALLHEARRRVPQAEASARVRDMQALRHSLARRTGLDGSPIKPQRVYHEMNNVFGPDAMFTTGCGLAQIWSGQFQKIDKPRKYLPSGGAGTLGFDIPAAIGAMVAAPPHKAVAVMGDFGFTFLVEELAVASKYKIPLVVVIVNNAYLSLIRQNQKYAYSYEYAVEMEENQNGMIDYVKVAHGFGCMAERVSEAEGIAPALERARDSALPYVIDIVVERRTDCSMGATVAGIREFE